jgi:hypothetical protein
VLALSGALTAGPRIAEPTAPTVAQATRPTTAQTARPLTAQAVSGQSYGYPIEPFDREHLIRANLSTDRKSPICGERTFPRTGTSP